jgi:4-carboxymuconolactone decarboxylase
MTTGQTRAQQIFGDFAPKLAELSDEVLYGDIWERPGLSPRDRSLITVAAIVALYRTDQMPTHIRRALANGVTPEELSEAFVHLAFYAGWPCGVNAVVAAREIIEGPGAKD